MNKYITKLAKESQRAKERPHVEDALNKLENSGGVLTHWSTGSGKTRNFLLAVERDQAKNKQGRSLIVAPASLVTNVDKEIKKHKLKIDRKRLDVYSYEKAVRISDQLKNTKYNLAIADEAQKLRNTGTQRSKELSEVFAGADKRLLATATGNYNHSADIAPLMNIVRGDSALPEDRKKFEAKFVGKEKKTRTLTEFLMGNTPEEVDVLKNKRELEIGRAHV